jgi:asparagine synthase (glutamine-hydrolysing)
MGADCVQKLRGMFAFALWDEKGQKLLIGRDRLGKKPLHYALHRGTAVFRFRDQVHPGGSAGVGSRSIGQALLQYMYLGYIPDPATAFLEFTSCRPGILLEFERGEVRIRNIGTCRSMRRIGRASEEECLEELEWRLAEAVRIRLISDVPLGAMLSGGTDSSTVVASDGACEFQAGKDLRHWFKQADFDESQYARMVAERFATDHHELILEPDVVGTVSKS